MEIFECVKGPFGGQIKNTQTHTWNTMSIIKAVDGLYFSSIDCQLLNL